MIRTMLFAGFVAIGAIGAAPAPAQRAGFAPMPRAAVPPGGAGFVQRGFAPRRHHRRPGGRTGAFDGFGYGLPLYGGEIDPELGFYAQAGEAVKAGERAVYVYDRGYPYDWYRPSGAPGQPRLRRRGWRCENEGGGVRVCRGG
jgi:hypothetical protein